MPLFDTVPGIVKRTVNITELLIRPIIAEGDIVTQLGQIIALREGPIGRCLIISSRITGRVALKLSADVTWTVFLIATITAVVFAITQPVLEYTCVEVGA